MTTLDETRISRRQSAAKLALIAMLFSYDDCPAGIVSPAILKAGKSSKT